MAFESEIPQSFRTKYRDNVQFLLEQGDSKLLPAVTQVDASGELFKLTDHVGDVNAYTKTGRNDPTEYLEVNHDGRWVSQPDPIVAAMLVDSQDKLASGIDLQGSYTSVGSRAIARGTDDIIIGGIFGTVQTGRKGTVQTAFDSSNVVPVNEGGAGNTNLTIAKLRAAWEILAANHVDLDMEEFYMAITASQAASLMAEVQAVSKDYAARGDEIRDGRLHKLFGFNFVHIELGNPRFSNASLTVDGSGYRKNPFWAKSGMVAAFWERLFTDVTRLPTRHYSAQVYARRAVEAARMEEGKVGYVLSNEA